MQPLFVGHELQETIGVLLENWQICIKVPLKLHS